MSIIKKLTQDLQEIVKQAGYEDCDSLSYIVPDNITNIVKKLKELEKEAGK